MPDVALLHTYEDRALGWITADDLRAYAWASAYFEGDYSWEPSLDSEAVLAAAHCVVIWSKEAVAQAKLVERAREHHEAGRLIQLRRVELDPSEIPDVFRNVDAIPVTEPDRLDAALRLCGFERRHTEKKPAPIEDLLDYLTCKQDAHEAMCERRPHFALPDYDCLVAYEPDRTRWREARAECHAAIGRHDRALADWNEILRLDPSHGKALLSRAETFEKLGRPDLAMSGLDAAVATTPSASAYIARGRMHARRGHHDMAIADFSQAISCDLRYERVTGLQLRAESFDVLGMVKEAVDDRAHAGALVEEANRRWDALVAQWGAEPPDKWFRLGRACRRLLKWRGG